MSLCSHEMTVNVHHSTSKTPLPHTRSRFGCKTCKIRRVKCDETKPECTKCISTGRKCDGYDILQVFNKRRPPPTVLMVVHHGITFHYGKHISCQYFHEVSIPALSNYNSASFWNTTVQQACVAEECIRELAIAISCIERFNVEHQSQSSQTGKECFVQHYCRGLHLLSKHQDANMVMTGSLLLIVIGDMTKNPYTAFVHISAGQKLLSEGKTAVNVHLVASLQPIFDRLVAHSPELSVKYNGNERWQDDLLFTSQEVSAITANSQPATLFHNLEEAAFALYNLRHSCLSLGRPTPPLTRFHVVPGITELLNSWLEDFNAFISARSLEERFENRAKVHSLRVYHLILSIASRCYPYESEKLFDNHSHDFEGLVKKLTRLSHMGSNNLAPLLFFVVCKYRDFAGRRSALNMLRCQACGAEGTCLSEVAESVITMEEATIHEPVTLEDIPEHTRVRPQAIFQDATNLPSSRPRLGLLRWPYRKDSNVEYVILSTPTQDNVDQHTVEWRAQVLQNALQLQFHV